MITDTMIMVLFDIAKQILDYIMANKYLSLLFISSIIGVACYVVRKVKKTAKH